MNSTVTTPAAAPVALPVRPSKLDGFQDVETQPLWFRKRVAEGTIAGLSKIELFDQRKNAAPHLTNCEEAGSMPNTSGFRIAGIELVPNANCTDAAWKAMLACTRLVVEVGTKGIEKVNQPSVFFGSSVAIGEAHNTASVKPGIFRLNEGEEINFEPDQPFRMYLQVDDIGFSVSSGQKLDFFVKGWGQKRGRVSLG